MLFNLKQFKEKKFGVVCETKGQANQLLKFLKDQGLEWCNGKDLVKSDNKWDAYRENTFYVCEPTGVAYGSKDYTREYILIPYNDLVFEDNIKDVDGATIKCIISSSTLPLTFVDPHPNIEISAPLKIYTNKAKRTVVVKWNDGTTTKATCSEEDHFDIAVGFAMAYVKKVYGGKKKLLRTINKLSK